MGYQIVKVILKSGKVLNRHKVINSELLMLEENENIADLFGVERSVVTKHLRNIFECLELKETSVSAKIAHTASDGKMYQTQFYNLDAIISVGYRTNCC